MLRSIPNDRDLTKPDGRSYLVAGANLLQWSGLCFWDENQLRFVSMENADFGSRWTVTHARFGRLIHWSVFSIGAEYFAKGACLLNNVLKPRPNSKLVPPDASDDLVTWARALQTERDGWHCGTLESLIRSSFTELSICDDERILLVAGYKLLKDIRNRDLHRFALNVREGDFGFVGRIFVPCLNILAACVPGGCAAANQIITTWLVK